MAVGISHVNAGALTTSFLPTLKSGTGAPVQGRRVARRLTHICAYTVAPGDTLWKISQKEGVNFAALKEANKNILNPNVIYPGQTVIVSGKVATTSVAPSGLTPKQKNIGVTIIFVLLGAAIYSIFASKKTEEEPIST
ncbi:LysM domain containing protein [Klebsormidium nitens]|uniref:LysM domain containing protein n=1 Tax=Klebsormidium nitens TaxID=105231 RepID=A0A1Y1HK99_KLENI|nr:LysM domain containing protein [Klebsormidium nitens]|eukprot:GAQ78995.1 LysM domain containing protein [Klebsormidium nitens]